MPWWHYRILVEGFNEEARQREQQEQGKDSGAKRQVSDVGDLGIGVQRMG